MNGNPAGCLSVMVYVLVPLSIVGTHTCHSISNPSRRGHDRLKGTHVVTMLTYLRLHPLSAHDHLSQNVHQVHRGALTGVTKR